MNSKLFMTFSAMAIAAVVLLFASGPIVGNQQALAYGYHGHGHYYYHGHGHYYYHGHGYYHRYYHHPYYHGHYYRHYSRGHYYRHY
ncbi:MAG: hypothetical protein WAM14_21385 [Candidatus Nitrosopolaris sp.]